LWHAQSFANHSTDSVTHTCSALSNVTLGAQAAGMAVDAGAEPMEGVETAKAAAGTDGAGIPDDALSAIMAKAQEYVAAAQEGCTRLLRGKMIALACSGTLSCGRGSHRSSKMLTRV
jgi:hypothetical protein